MKTNQALKSVLIGSVLMLGVAVFTDATISSITYSINGVVFKNVSFYLQAIIGIPKNPATLNQSYAQNNTGNLITTFTSSLQNGAYFSGDVELNAKPTWAY